MSGLDSETKARIEAEERYRAEIRARVKQENQPKPPPELSMVQEFENRKAQSDVEKTRWLNNSAMAVIWVVLIGVIWFIYPTIFPGKTPAQIKSEEDQTNNEQAKRDFAVECQLAIDGQLKSPSTAKFAGITPDEVTQIDNSFSVASTVDAQNSFGAVVRTDFICLKKNGALEAKLLP